MQTEAVVIDVQNGVDQGVHLSMGSRGFLDLAGDSGLKNLVLVGAEVVDEEGFTFQPSDADKFVYNVSRGKEGNWYVESVGEDNYELKWWDGEYRPLYPFFSISLWRCLSNGISQARVSLLLPSSPSSSWLGSRLRVNFLPLLFSVTRE